jgi:ATP-binding cassette subfamily C (CFTR/MRP) protein 1
MNMLPIIISITVFAVYAATEGEKALTPAKVYTVISLFNLIATPLRLIVMTAINLINAKASLNRIEHFFGYGDKDLTNF